MWTEKGQIDEIPRAGTAVVDGPGHTYIKPALFPPAVKEEEELMTKRTT